MHFEKGVLKKIKLKNILFLQNSQNSKVQSRVFRCFQSNAQKCSRR
jgi:hypothetical protein